MQMTQNLAQCSNCHGMVMHLEATAVVSRCDRCKGEAKHPSGDAWRPPHQQEEIDE